MITGTIIKHLGHAVVFKRLIRSSKQVTVWVRGSWTWVSIGFWENSATVATGLVMPSHHAGLEGYTLDIVEEEIARQE